MSEKYYGILDELRRNLETPSPEPENLTESLNDNQSESSDEIPPLEPCLSEDEEPISDLPHFVKIENSQDFVNQEINSMEAEPGSTTVEPANNENSKETSSWRSLQPGETIDEALEKAKIILENIPLPTNPADSGITDNGCQALVPYSEPVDSLSHQCGDTNEVIILDDSSEDGPPEAPEVPSTRPVREATNEQQGVIILEDSTADSEVMEVVAEKEELKPVDDQVDDEDFEITGEKEGEILSHHRSDCPVHQFTKRRPIDPPIENVLFCEKCFCFMCDLAVSECNSWTSSGTAHCNAWRSSEWRLKKSLLKLKNQAEEAVTSTVTETPSVSQIPSTSGWGFDDYAWHNRNRELAARPQSSPPRWGESRSSWTPGETRTWGWEKASGDTRETSAPSVDLTNLPRSSAASAWEGKKSSSLKREHESKGSSSNGNSPNRSSDDSEVEFVADRTNEGEELGDDGPILNLGNISRFEWRMEEEERERQRKRRKEMRREREYRPPTHEDISFWDKQREELQRNPSQKSRIRHSSWDDEPPPVESAGRSNNPSTSGLGPRSHEQSFRGNHRRNWNTGSRPNFHPRPTYNTQNGYRQNYSDWNSRPPRPRFRQNFNHGEQLRSAHTYSPVLSSIQRPPYHGNREERSGPIYNNGSRTLNLSNEETFTVESTSYAGQNQLMPKRRKQTQLHQMPTSNSSFNRGYNHGSRS